MKSTPNPHFSGPRNAIPTGRPQKQEEGTTAQLLVAGTSNQSQHKVYGFYDFSLYFVFSFRKSSKSSYLARPMAFQMPLKQRSFTEFSAQQPRAGPQFMLFLDFSTCTSYRPQLPGGYRNATWATGARPIPDQSWHTGNNIFHKKVCYVLTLTTAIERLLRADLEPAVSGMNRILGSDGLTQHLPNRLTHDSLPLEMNGNTGQLEQSKQKQKLQVAGILPLANCCGF